MQNKLRIKILFSILLLITGVCFKSISKISEWNPILFFVPEEVFLATLDNLEQEKDTVLIDLLKNDPSYKDFFASNVSKFLTIALNSITQGSSIYEKIEKEDNIQEGVYKATYFIGKIIKNIEIFTFENVLYKSNQKIEPITYKYKYCETHPENTEDWCVKEEAPSFEHEFNYIYEKGKEYVLIRRVLSHPSFVNKICSTAMPFAEWFVSWGAGTTHDELIARQNKIKPLFDVLNNRLNELYSNGDWSTSHLKQILENNEIDSTIDPQLLKFMVRRYLDGGPQLISAYQNCLKQVENLFLEDKKYEIKDSYLEIEKLISFKQLKGDSIKFAKVNWYGENKLRYRLSHHLRIDDEISKDLNFENSDVLNSNYLDKIEDLTSWSETAFLNLIQHLNQIDSKYYYRPMTFTEYKELNDGDKLDEDSEIDFTCLPEVDFFKSKNPNEEIFHQIDYKLQDYPRKLKDITNTCIINYIVRTNK